jgi:hypothetical protein
METKDEEGNLIINNNGVWTNTTINIPELIATYLKVWLEDSVPTDLVEGIKASQGLYTEEKQKDALAKAYDNLTNNRILEMQNSLARLEEAKTQTTNA